QIQSLSQLTTASNLALLRTSKFFKTPAFAGLVAVNDRRKRFRVQTRSAHKSAVEFLLCHQPLNVVRLDAAAVENPYAGGQLVGKLITRTPAQEPVSRSGNFGRSRTTRPNCPDWLVS